MALYEDVIAEVEKQPSGSHIGAIFDFDGTVIYGYSAVAFVREQVKQGHLNPRQFVELVSAMAAFGLGNMGFSAMMIVASQFMRGGTEESYFEFGELLYEKYLAKLIYPETRALIEAHIRKGHSIAVISSATPYQVEPAARALNIEDVMCTKLEVVDGVLTGKVMRPTCFGEGKVRAAEEFAQRRGVDLEKTFFYTDSDDDLQLLERVGNPRPLNPNRNLTSIALRRGWPMRRFKSRGRGTVVGMARSLAATASPVASLLAGIPIWALTGSLKEAQNFSISLFADAASALIGMDMHVRGEHHLWSNRPAVFIFNHQSQADVVVLTRLLRRDIAGVGKKEIRNIPVVGRAFELAGTVLIDRSNSASAVEAMAPLVKLLQEGEKSVILAPEGTRSTSPKLGPFKKGAFHLAMQAGVPIVPIVIHNALDVQPKGDFIYHPALVEVDVLPPIDTSDWTVDNLNEQIEAVREQFLQTLNQNQDGLPTAGEKQLTVVKDEVGAKPKPARARSGTATRSGAAKSTARKTTRPRAASKSKVTKKAASTMAAPGTAARPRKTRDNKKVKAAS